MSVDYQAVDEGDRRSRPLLRALILILIGFALGIAAMAYAVSRWQETVNLLRTGRLTAPTPATLPAPAPLRVVMPPPPIAATTQAEIDRRVGSLEARIDRIDARASAAVGNADRAEGLLVAFAARRALDRGVALGYIETLLRDRFGGDQPQAVATIIAAAHQPVTLDQLQAGLEEAAPELTVTGPGESWWTGFRRELAGLVVIRRKDTPSPAPEDRLARARSQLQAGHVDAALAEVSRMPGRAAAAAWIGLARRYAAARGALDAIETAALLSPRERASIAAADIVPRATPAGAPPRLP